MLWVLIRIASALVSIDNICFYEDIWKIISQLSLIPILSVLLKFKAAVTFEYYLQEFYIFANICEFDLSQIQLPLQTYE